MGKDRMRANFKPDPKALGDNVNALLLYVHNRVAQDITSEIQGEILNPLAIELTPDQAYILGLQKARDLAKAHIKETITLK